MSVEILISTAGAHAKNPHDRYDFPGQAQGGQVRTISPIHSPDAVSLGVLSDGFGMVHGKLNLEVVWGWLADGLGVV